MKPLPSALVPDRRLGEVSALQDGDLNTAWSSPCWLCARNDAWVGIALSAEDTGREAVGCVRILQDEFDLYASPDATLQILDSAWTTVQAPPVFFRDHVQSMSAQAEIRKLRVTVTITLSL